MITTDKILAVQQKWADCLIKIGESCDDFQKSVELTENFLSRVYAFDHCDVLFKPTRASDVQFRLDKTSALSYYLGGNENYPEDLGFALQPWINVRFENAGMIIEDGRALVMGNYFLTDLSRNKFKVEYTFGMKFFTDELKIDLHHSSFPFDPLKN